MINIPAVCPCIFQRSRPALNWLTLIHLAFAKELLILSMLRPRFTCCSATSVFTSVCLWLFRNICRNEAQTINVRTRPQVSIHSRVQELCGWYKTFIFSPSVNLVDSACFVQMTFTDFEARVCLCVCILLISHRMMADALFPPSTFLISCC